VAINCAAIPDTLLEATLFGHEKGAFTGASSAQAGKFEQAEGGTLLLDEISEMPLGLQAKLLRVLQEREVERVGGKKAIPLDIRVLATTNRDMAKEVAAGRFPGGSVLPPQRVSAGDPVAPRAAGRHRAAGAALRAAPRGAPAAQRAALPEAEAVLVTYHWPGNVRELENTVQRA
jgi:two-component system response regulator FlrC